MDKKQRAEYISKGFTILRAKFNKKGYWQICYLTDKGGWSAFNLDTYENSALCNKGILNLVANPDNKYLIDM